MTEEEIQDALEVMEKDIGLKTAPAYTRSTANSIELTSFSERHLTYLKNHPKINPEHYLANLRAMIKIRAN